MVLLPTLVLPKEFVDFLKRPVSSLGGGEGLVYKAMQENRGLALVLDRAFKEFDEHKLGLDKVMTTLGWAHFRERLASVYLFKAINGVFPQHTDMDLVSDLHDFENRFVDRAVAGNSRVFLLGFYLRLWNIQRSEDAHTVLDPIEMPTTVDAALVAIPGKSSKIDWLMLLCWHFDSFLGSQKFQSMLKAGTDYRSLLALLTPAQARVLTINLLAYGASVGETDPFLYERI